MILSFAESGLATFIRLYAEIHAEGIQGPEPSKLHEIMRSKLNELEENREPVKRVQEDGPTSSVKEPPSVSSAPAPQASAPKKVDVRDLKKLTYKKKRKITKGEKAGEEIEENILVELPYLPHCVDYSSGCQALKLNGGLLNPCLTRPIKGLKFCKACGETPKFGTISDRESVEFGCYCVSVERVDAKTKEKKESTKKEISYGTWLDKQKLERSFVEKLLVDHGLGDISIPESCFEVKKTKKRSSTKKSPSTSSDEETSSVEEEAASVEPAAQEPQEDVPQEASVENVSVEVPSEEAAQEQESVDGSVEEASEKKKRGRPKKEKSEKDAEDPNAPKKKRGRPKKVTKPIVEEDDLDEVSISSQELEETTEEKETLNTVIMKDPPQDGDEDDVVYFDYNGMSYCYDDEYTICLIDESNPDGITMVGTWDPETNKPEWNEGYEP